MLGRPLRPVAERRSVLGADDAALGEVDRVPELLRLRGHGAIVAEMPSGQGRSLRSVRRLRTLTEAECWARCYGAWDSTVSIVHLEPRRPRFPTTVSGEDIRKSLEERLDRRAVDEVEAA